MLKASLLEIFERDLNKLKEELKLYKDERAIWMIQGEISNCAGNLSLHLIGNLNHFIGTVLGRNGYVRDRDLEFSAKGVARTELIAQIDKTLQVIQKTLDSIGEPDLFKEFPVEKHGQNVTTDFMLLHLATHLNYHLGQVNYHRRLIG